MTRVIYSLHFDLEPDPDGNSRELIAVLNPDGNSDTCQTDKRRVIDLRDGDLLRHGGRDIPNPQGVCVSGGDVR